MEKRFGQPLAWIIFDAAVDPPVVKGSYQVGAPVVTTALRDFLVTPAPGAGAGQVAASGLPTPAPGLCLVDVEMTTEPGVNFRLPAWRDDGGGPAIRVRVVDAAGAAADATGFIQIVWYGGTAPGSV